MWKVQKTRTVQLGAANSQIHFLRLNECHGPISYDTVSGSEINGKNWQFSTPVYLNPPLIGCYWNFVTAVKLGKLERCSCQIVKKALRYVRLFRTFKLSTIWQEHHMTTCPFVPNFRHNTANGQTDRQTVGRPDGRIC